MREYDATQIQHILGSQELLPEQMKVLKRWDLEADKNEGLAVASRRNQLARIFAFARVVKKDFRGVTREDIEDYLFNLEMAPASIDQTKIYIKKFYKWLYQSEKPPEIVSWIKIPNRRNKNGRVLQMEILSPSQVKELIDAADNPMHRALISVTYESAGRVGEILGLKIKQVTIDQYGAVIIINGKTGPRRIRLINSAPDLTLWINNHPYKEPDRYVFISPRDPGKSLTDIAVQKIIKALAKKVGIEMRVFPHLLRHSSLTRKAEDYTDADLKIIAGWTADSRMPVVYIHRSGGDVEKKQLRLAGLLKENESGTDDVLKARNCPRCKENNPSTAKFCYRCGMALDIETAMKIDTESQGMSMELLDLIQKQPRLLDLLKNLSNAAAQNGQAKP